MTENKRFFLLEYKNNLIYDSEKDTEYSVQFKKQKQNLCDLLNEQSDKITEQAIQIDFLKDENKHMKQVLEENRQLKQKNMYFLKIMFALKNYIENEDYEQIEKVIDKIKKEMI